MLDVLSLLRWLLMLDGDATGNSGAALDPDG